MKYAAESELLITVGVSEALLLALTSVLEQGDEVIVPEPCFVAYQPTVVFAGGVPVAVPTYVAQDFQVTVDDLERMRTPRTKAVLLGYPNNPTGAVLSRDRLVDIAEWADANDLLVVSDEIYDRLVYGVEHTCFSSLPGMRERTILLGGKPNVPVKGLIVFTRDLELYLESCSYPAAPLSEVKQALKELELDLGSERENARQIDIMLTSEDRRRLNTALSPQAVAAPAKPAPARR